jgi:hypothetical protein
LFEDSGWREITTYQDDLRHERVVHAVTPMAAASSVSREAGSRVA